MSNAQNVVIPDAIFKTYLVGNTAINTNADAEIQVSEAAAFTGYLNLYSMGIYDLTGIEAFTALTYLGVGSNNLTSINITLNTALTTLYCGGNSLTSLNVSSNTALVNLNCGNNSLTSLNVSSNTALYFLNCEGNSLTSLNVSSNTALVNLNCGNNSLTSLNVSSNTALSTLFCYGNSLISLNISLNPNLQILSCYGNSLTSLNVSSNPLLYDFDCSYNNLSVLNVKNGNNINFNNFYAVSNPLLTCISVDNVAYSNTNWSSYKDATASYNTYCSFPTSLKLLSFTANKCNRTNACINWHTTDEQNFKNYELQQSQDGINFKTIYSVNGKNTSTNDYQFVDENKSGTVYYRLKMNDIDGQYTFSSIENIDFGKLATIEITPNPASSIVTLNGLNNIQKIDIISMQGQVLKTVLVNANQSIIDISNIPNGIYQLKLSSDEQSQIERLVIEH